MLPSTAAALPFNRVVAIRQCDDCFLFATHDQQADEPRILQNVVFFRHRWREAEHAVFSLCATGAAIVRALSFYKRTPLTDCSLLASMGFSSIVHTVVHMADYLCCGLVLEWTGGSCGRATARAMYMCTLERLPISGTSRANNDRSAAFPRWVLIYCAPELRNRVQLHAAVRHETSPRTFSAECSFANVICEILVTGVMFLGQPTPLAARRGSNGDSKYWYWGWWGVPDLLILRAKVTS
jgi:hypothetical protein